MLFSYRMKCFLRNRELVFWTLLFPLLLATLFHLAFGQLTVEREQFTPIPTAVIDNDFYRQDMGLQRLLMSVSESEKNRMLDLALVSREEAEELLSGGEIDGIIVPGETPELVVWQFKETDSGNSRKRLNQSILRAFLDEYAQKKQALERIALERPEALTVALATLNESHDYLLEKSFSDASPDSNLDYFFALIAFTCLNGSYWGLRNTLDTQADLSPAAARRGVAPTPKLQVIVADAAAAWVMSLLEVAVLLLYLALVLRVPLGNQPWLIFLTCVAGCLAGVAFGTLEGTLFRKSENVKVAILISSTLLLSFFGGLMVPNMRHWVAHRWPWFSYVNPVSLVADAFYSLYTYADNRRFFFNISMLLGVALVLCFLSYTRLRREKYAAI